AGADAAALLRADAVLDPQIAPTGEPVDPVRVAAPAHLLLTGATGFLGAHLLARLLAVTGARLHVLVDAEGPGEAERALDRALRRFRLTVPRERVTVVPGSLREPLLGLSPMTFARLAATVDAIHHTGGDPDPALPYERLRPAVAGGTAEVLRLAARGRTKPVHHLSSPGVLAARDPGPGPGPGPEAERAPDHAHAPYAAAAALRPDGRVPAEAVPAAGPVRARWVAEELVEEGRRRGVPVSVYRAGRLGGETGSGAVDPGSPFWRFLGACTEVSAVPDLGAGTEFDLVPVDHAAAALAALSLRTDASGGTYHLANPVRTRLGAVVDRLRAAGYPLVETDPGRWAGLVAAEALDPGGDESAVPAALAEAAPGLPVLGGLRLDVSGTLAALDGTGVRCPAVEGPLLDRYVEHAVGAGLLAPPPDRAGRHTRDSRSENAV
ncbi:SDR family oxidoreductase, partial [Streptomyces boncukensis]